MTASPESVLAFWFGAPGSATEIAARQRGLWFGKSAEADRKVIEQFGDTLRDAREGHLDYWVRSPRDRLALVIVLDQFPHHVYRNQAAAFDSDAQSLAIALQALATGEDRQLTLIERVFLYLPLEHAEDLAMQQRSVECYQSLVQMAPDEATREYLLGTLDYAHKHQDVIERFGRFPHRNAILGRPSTAQESDYLAQPGSGF